MKRSLIAVLSLGSCLFISLVFTQANAVPDTLLPQVEALNDEGKYDEAIALVQPAILSAQQLSKWDLYTDYIVEFVRAQKGKENYLAGLAMLEEAQQIFQKQGQFETINEAKLWRSKALVYRKQEQHSDALAAYEKAIYILKKRGVNSSELAYVYKNAAQTYMRYSNNRKAVQYFQAALDSDSTFNYGASIYGQLVDAWIFLDSLPAAAHYFQIGMQIADETDPYYYVTLLTAGANLAMRQDNLQLARTLTLKALGYFQNKSDFEDNRMRSLETLAEIAIRVGDTAAAIRYFQQAEVEGKKAYEGKSREMANLYRLMGRFYEQQKNPTRALALYQQALVQAFPNFNSLDPNDNPPLVDAYLESMAMQAAAAKAQLLIGPDRIAPATRLNAAHCFDLAIAVATRLRRTYGDDADKYALAADNEANFKSAAQNLSVLYRETQDKVHLARLFALFEQTRATVLADALQKQRALVLSGIPDSLLAREQRLRLQAAEVVKTLKNMEMKGDSVELERLKPLVLRQQKAYDDLLADWQNRYPQFAHYVQADQVAELSTIQTALSKATTLLSFFDAGDRYLCLAVQNTRISAFEVPRDSALKRDLDQFLRLLASRGRQESAPADYFALAYNLGQRLLPADLLGSNSHLIILPDGQLCYLPFEALLTAPHQGSFASAPYLLRNCTVQYAWSATLLTMAQDARLVGAPEEGLLQIAPFVTNARDGLAPLPNSLRDRPEDLPATVLAGEQASATAFLQEAPRHSVLHLSTHASAGGKGEPGIEFAERRLTLPEIYAQRFHASLVSLSACETGAGRFAEGEGVLSLARAFAYAGAQSLVASQWSVNERSTAELFSSFYKNLKRGMSKSEALRQAKLAYLASTEMDVRKAPYHWAAFTLTGADGSVQFGAPWWQHWTLWLGGGLAMLLLGFWFYRRKA